MPENQIVSEKVASNTHSRSRFIGALILGSIVGVFIGLIAMALTIIVCGVLRLFFPSSAFQLAGMNATAVIFVIFYALGWAGGTILLWHKLPHFATNG